MPASLQKLSLGCKRKLVQSTLNGMRLNFRCVWEVGRKGNSFISHRDTTRQGAASALMRAGTVVIYPCIFQLTNAICLCFLSLHPREAPVGLILHYPIWKIYAKLHYNPSFLPSILPSFLPPTHPSIHPFNNQSIHLIS